MKYLFPLLLLLFACDQKKAKTADTTDPAPVPSAKTAECTIDVFVMDLQGMDGCSFLFQTAEGEKYLPNSVPDPSFEFEANQMLSIGYTEVKDGASICMMESKIIDVHCMEFKGLTGGIKPMKNQCEKVESITESDWLSRLKKENNAYKITRYDYLSSRYAYLVDNGRYKQLYDCAGSLICRVEGKAMNECYHKISKMKGELLIWDKDARN